MKNLSLVILAALFFAGCSKDNDLGGLLASMKATIDNEEFSTITRVTAHSEGKFLITGNFIDGKILVITIFGDAEGKYELNTSSAKCAAVYKESLSSSTEDTYASLSGEVNLTKVDTDDQKISGTFNFSLKRDISEGTISITNGEFNNLKYTEQEIK